MAFGRMKTEKRGKETFKKEDQERQNDGDNNCLSSLLMPLWFYRLYRYAKGRNLLLVKF